MNSVLLQKEDFRDFKIGAFPYDHEHSAMGEYHFYPPEGYRGNWYCPITDYTWRGPMWLITNEGDKRVMESTILRPQDSNHPLQQANFWNTLTTGGGNWDDYCVKGGIRLLKTDMTAGFAVRYQNSRCYYALCFDNGRVNFIKRKHEEYVILSSVAFEADFYSFYNVRIECRGDSFKCYINENYVLEAKDSEYEKGKIALLANCPAQFFDINITTDEATYKRLKEEESSMEAALENLRSEYPQPKLWKKLNLRDFGAGRSVRFGDLTGNGAYDILIAQCQKRVWKDCYGNISCLTAINLDGEVIWQIGEPDPENTFITADLPFQIADINLDGKNEVVIAKDFKIMILEGSTGRVLKSVNTPVADTPMEKVYSGVPFGAYAFDRVNVDSIRICNFTGKERPTDILIKDRYNRVWVYDSELNFLWSYNDGITGHFPYTKDINGDGKDEMFVGYNLVGPDGRKLWTLPVETDHTDEIIIGRLDPEEEEERICIVSGSEGFMMADTNGNIKVRELIGHAQRISTGNYRPDLKGLEIAVTTFWGNQGIILLYNCKGELLYSFEPGSDGNIIAPVNWTGDGRDLILLNGNVKFGGMIDGYGNKVVTFPEDGHPDLCCEVLDLTGDLRDEIVLWNTQEMWIYTQNSAFNGDKIYNPEKYPHYNSSNYRGEYSWSKWKEVKE